MLTKFLPYTLRVPWTIADLFWLSIQGTVTVLFASEEVCPCKGIFRAVGWLRFRELCPSGDLWGETRKRPAVHFTLPFPRYPEYVRRVGTFSNRPAHLIWPSRHRSVEFGQRDRDHHWDHSTRFGEVTEIVRLSVSAAVSKYDRSRNEAYRPGQEDDLHQPGLVRQCNTRVCLAVLRVLSPPRFASLKNENRERHTALEVGFGAPGPPPGTHSNTKIELSWYEGKPHRQQPDFYQSSWTDFAENLSLTKIAVKNWLHKLALTRSSLIWMQMN